MNKRINIGDWIEVTIKGKGYNVKVLGFSEKGIDIYDEWDKHLLHWRDIETIKVEEKVKKEL